MADTDSHEATPERDDAGNGPGRAPAKSGQTDSDTDPTATPKAKKKAADRQKILVGAAIVGVILTYLVLRSSSSSAADDTAADDESVGDSDGDTGEESGDYGGGGYGGDEDGVGGYGAEILAELQTIASNQSTGSGSSGSGSSGGASTPKTGIGTNYAKEKLIGSGYNAGGKGAVVSKTNNLYDFASNFTKGTSLTGKYVQTSEGHFEEASKVKNLKTGTPLYSFKQKVS